MTGSFGITFGMGGADLAYSVSNTHDPQIFSQKICERKNVDARIMGVLHYSYVLAAASGPDCKSFGMSGSPLLANYSVKPIAKANNTGYIFGVLSSSSNFFGRVWSPTLMDWAARLYLEASKFKDSDLVKMESLSGEYQ